jgi:hypothetical protein
LREVLQGIFEFGDVSVRSGIEVEVNPVVFADICGQDQEPINLPGEVLLLEELDTEVYVQAHGPG